MIGSALFNMTPSNIQFNPFSPEFHQNPYPVYARLQAEDPIHWSFLKAWVITCYTDVAFVLQDSRFKVDDLPERIGGKLRSEGSSQEGQKHDRKRIVF